jgi:hypothetical protein
MNITKNYWCWGQRGLSINPSILPEFIEKHGLWPTGQRPRCLWQLTPEGLH